MNERRITELIQAAATRSARDTAALVANLSDRCWPGGGDRLDPVATEWLRRWSPKRMAPGALDCSCASGRCAWCN